MKHAGGGKLGLANVSPCAKYEGCRSKRFSRYQLPKIDLEQLGQGHLKLMDLKGLPTCPPVTNMKAVGQTVLKISPAKD